MSKSLEQLKQLNDNPFYHLTDAEKLQLSQAESQEQSQEPKGVDRYPKVVVSSKGSATVKEIGRLNKHDGDPVSET